MLRGELAVGQFADLVNDARRSPSLDDVLDVTRRKSGNYTVRRPLELGATLAGCGEQKLGVLGEYGELVGEAFQLRDDVLGVFGGRPSPASQAAVTCVSARRRAWWCWPVRWPRPLSAPG